MEIREFGLGLCMEIIAFDVIYLRELTLLNLEF